MDAETLAALRSYLRRSRDTHSNATYVERAQKRLDCFEYLVALAARVPQLEAERDEAKRALYDRDEYSRKTRCDCHETSMGDPDYAPAFQDEYQRLWHESRARVAQLETALTTAASDIAVVNAAGFDSMRKEIAEQAIDRIARALEQTP